MGQIAILGASGMIGSAIAKELNDNGHTLRTLGRSSSNQRLLDLYNPDAIEPSVFEGCDTLIHAAGVIDEDFKTSSREGFLKGTYAAKKISESAFDAGVRTFVYISSAHIYGPLNGALSENSPPNPISDYAISHYATEQIMRRTANKDKSGRILILRPCATYGVPAEIKRFQRWTLIPFQFPQKIVRDRKIELWAGSNKISRNYISAKGIGEHVAQYVSAGTNGVTIRNPVGAYAASVYDFAKLNAAIYIRLTGNTCDVIMPPDDVPAPPALVYTSTSPTQYNGQSIEDFIEQMISALNDRKAA